MKRSISIFLLAGMPVLAFSQNEESWVTSLLDLLYENIIIVLALIVMAAVLVTFYKLLTNILLFDKDNITKRADKTEFDDRTFLDRMYDKAWSIVPVREESKIDLGHDYDGIRELDNRLPPWWLALFYGSIAFAAIYMYVYHWSGNDWSSQKQWEEQVEKGEAVKQAYLNRMANLVNENNVELLTAPNEIAAGKLIFENYTCQTCHGNMGEGNAIGPNLTDEYWLNGGGVKNIFTTIKYGVPEKGMISWKDQLTPSQMQKVASYIVSLQGTNPPNPKDPQGEIWTGDEG